MARAKKYMVVHENPGIDCDEIQANWRKLADVETATWVRTYFNEEKGIRYCLWLAQNEDQLKKIFSDMDVSWVSIVQVDETIPDLWGEGWNKHLEAEKSADTLGV